MARALSFVGGLTAIAAVLGTAAPAAAFDPGSNDGSAFELGAGAFDVLHDRTAGLVRGQYDFGIDFWKVKPFIGAEVSTDGGAYGYFGFGLDIYLDDAWVLNPNAAVGAWTRGSGKDLGSTIEFRTGAEVDYRFDDRSRFGFSFHHISNAGIGKRNPGEEEALAVYHLPLTFP